MKRNYFIVDYSNWELLVSLGGVRHTIDLRKGFVGDCWSEITNLSGERLEVSFYQESKYILPIVGVYGRYDADTSYCISVEYLGCLGNMDDYFGAEVIDSKLMEVKRLLMDKFLLKHNTAEQIVRTYADIIIQGLFDGKSGEEIIKEVKL